MKRLAVAVSGAGTNLRALQRATRRGELGAEICLVVADRACPALDAASADGIPIAVVSADRHADREGWDRALAETLAEARPDLVVLAGFMRLVGRSTLQRFPGRILNVHPSLLPAYPGAHAVRAALAGGAKVTGVTVHLVDETLDGGPVVLQEAVPVLASDDDASLLERLHAVEHRLLPRAVALALAGALSVEGRSVRLDPARAADLPRPRRALVSVSDKRGLAEFGRALVELGFELVSTGGTARTLRGAGLEVTDVAAVTGFPEMLDGRVKTLHPRIHAGVLADGRRSDHRSQLAAAGIDPFELVVVDLYPFEEAAARPDLSLDELIEEIDVGGPALVRAAAKNHASVAVVTEPAQYESILEELRVHGRLGDETRGRLAVRAFARTSTYDTTIARVLRDRLDGAAEAAAPEAVFPPHLALDLERTLELRYGENPHQAAALYRIVGRSSGGPFADGVQQLQGRELSYNNILDAAAAAGLARDLRGPACVVVKHTNPCGAAEAADPLAAWELALAGDPLSAFGGVVAITTPVDAALAERLTSLFLEVVVAPAVEPEAASVLAARPNLRVVLDPGLAAPAPPGLELRSAGGGLLATESDVQPDERADWQTVTARAPSADELRDLDLAWRVCRHVKSNAIVLVRDRAVVGVGAGQMSRVDSARLAVEKAGRERARGSVCASDAFFPFADGVEACAAAGVTAFVQPGGSVRDAEVIAAADRAGAAMLFTGRRHFRH